jgi:hypothetical protein
MEWYILLRTLRPEQNRPEKRTGPTDRTPLRNNGRFEPKTIIKKKIEKSFFEKWTMFSDFERFSLFVMTARIIMPYTSNSSGC